MKRFKALLYVDEEQLRKSTGDNESPVDVLVEQELGWCKQSGIFAYYVTEEPVDINGNIIELGDKVVWHDPDEEHRDLSVTYEVVQIRDEIIIISNDYSEAEVFPNELEVI